MNAYKFDLIFGVLALPPIYGLTFALGAAAFGYGAPARAIIAAFASL